MEKDRKFKQEREIENSGTKRVILKSRIFTETNVKKRRMYAVFYTQLSSIHGVLVNSKAAKFWTIWSG